MRLLIFSILQICFFGIILAQTQARVVYTYTSYGGYEREMELLIKDGSCKFIYHTEDETLINDQGWEFYHYFEHYESYFSFQTNQVTEIRRFEDKTQLLATWPLDLNWVITDETKTIGEYKAQKAICHSHYEAEPKGNKFYYGDAIAWFSTEIPFPFGPNRYYGLPGLIVHLEFSDRGNISSTMKRIIYEEVDPIVIPEDGIEVSREEIIRPFLIDKKWLKSQKKALKSVTN